MASFCKVAKSGLTFPQLRGRTTRLLGNTLALREVSTVAVVTHLE
jgi:hypothetical protein